MAVPESSELNEDSVLLEDVAFDDQKRRANVQDPRRAALTSCVAGVMLRRKNTNPDDGFTNDQMRPYVAFALASPVDWLVHSAALLQRCRIEAHSVYSGGSSRATTWRYWQINMSAKTGRRFAPR